MWSNRTGMPDDPTHAATVGRVPNAVKSRERRIRRVCRENGRFRGRGLNGMWGLCRHKELCRNPAGQAVHEPVEALAYARGERGCGVGVTTAPRRHSTHHAGAVE